LVYGATAAGAQPIHVITSAHVDRSTLNIAAHENVTMTVDFAKSGIASVLVLDRDGFAVRALASAEQVRGTTSFTWNGRDDRGRLVADEAYSFRTAWHGRGVVDVYDAGEACAHVSAIAVGSFDRRTGSLPCTVPAPSAVPGAGGAA